MEAITTETNLMSQEEYDAYIDDINRKSNIKLAVISGLGWGLLSAVLWAGIVKITGMNIGIVAMGVGLFVSQGFVRAGRSTYKSMGIVAGLIAALSILLGKMFIILALLSEHWAITLYETALNVDFLSLIRFVIENTKTTDLLFYLFAIQVAYKRSFINEFKLDIAIMPTGTIDNLKE